MQTYQVGSSLVGSSVFSSNFETRSHSLLSLPSSVRVEGNPLDAHSVIIFSSHCSDSELKQFANIKSVFCESYSFLDIYCDESLSNAGLVSSVRPNTIAMDSNDSHCDTARQVLEHAIGRNVVVVANNSNLELCKQACELEGLKVVSTVSLCTKREELIALQ